MKIRPSPKAAARLARSRFQSNLELRRIRDDAHPASAAAGSSFDENRIADECGEFARCGNFSGLDSRYHWNSGCDRDSPRRDLVAQRCHYVGARSDEHDLRVGGSLREFGTLREKSVARMDRIGAGLFCGRDNCRDIEIALRSFGRTDEYRFVSRADMRTVRVCRRKHSYSFEAEHARTADNPKRNLAAICDQQFC